MYHLHPEDAAWRCSLGACELSPLFSRPRPPGVAYSGCVQYRQDRATQEGYEPFTIELTTAFVGRMEELGYHQCNIRPVMLGSRRRKVCAQGREKARSLLYACA